ncbi:hypothetical protein SO802_032414 [Lithocarpus litseifolius]|uniref:Uncharacterized protein n=1 Tax=Lithocarpus litseifolius TaxID=425828 RepID=A0AAW2BPN1_9ROSI
MGDRSLDLTHVSDLPLSNLFLSVIHSNKMEDRCLIDMSEYIMHGIAFTAAKYCCLHRIKNKCLWIKKISAYEAVKRDQIIIAYGVQRLNLYICPETPDFRFQPLWVAHPQFPEMVRDDWSKGSYLQKGN